MKKMNNYVAVIGCGPAGIATAIQLKRYRIDTIVFETDEVGGLLRNSYIVENYLGFPDGIPGIDLVNLFKKHLDSYDIQPVFEEVKQLDFNEDRYHITTNKSVYNADIVVIASGTKPIKPEIVHSLPTSIRDRIYYEIFSLRGIKNKKIIIVGAGDAGFDYALNLAQHNSVYILNRNREPKAIPILQEKVNENENIEYMDNTKIVEISPRLENSRVIVLIDKNREKIHLQCDYILYAIGREPQKDFYSGKMIKMENYLIDNARLYLVGDVKNGIYRQCTIAIADGIHAAMCIHRKIRK